uniref:Uncharacterized protein n=1 Tax=Daphnia galeata TaxID=27404 RepID=A0A8J2S5X7_9CRUS|nr:unnamed protein product [Daphnia galeata]
MKDHPYMVHSKFQKDTTPQTEMRNYIRKTARVQNVSRENVSKAIYMVRNHNWGVVDAAREFKLSERSLFRYLKVSANKEVDVDEDSLPLTCGYS